MRKENLVGKKRNLIYRAHWAKDLAMLGCITISMDQWGFGERGVRPWRALRKLRKYYVPERKYAQNMLQYGRTILGLRAFDVIRQVDYLLTRDDVDPKRIGIAGLSMGGLTAGTVAAIDPRITLALIAGYLCTYKDSIINLARKHCADMYTPGMLTLGEEHDLLSLIAPRPVCFISGSKDGIFPAEGAKKAFNKIKRAYSFLGAQDNCVLDMASMGHSWRGEVAYDFLKKQWF
jgi:pimeloyl-ACP methyl ester carboxylesterase